MAKKKNDSINIQEMLSKTVVKDIRIEDEMKKSFIAYAMAVNVSRAIPDVRDGLKPVHRRILYAMGNSLGLYSDKPYRKCAKIVGEVLGNFHPHGDSAVYEAVVRMAQPFSLRYPMVDGQGNFGSVDGDPAAAQRYTEARLSKIASEMLRDIDKETVDFYPNFDETCMQPRVLPSRIPSLLVNGSAGIAVGMATNIPPHNMTEVINGVIAQIDNPEITLDELMNYIPAPDFPTGGILMGRASIRQAYRTGNGGYVLRAKTDIEEFNDGTRQRIVVTEIPYQVNKAKLIEQIADLIKNKKIDGISALNDESDRDGMRIVIDVKRDANAQVVLNLLFKHSNLQVGSGINFLALVDGEPKVMPILEINKHYINHQCDVVERRTRYDLTRAEEREHIVQGLVIAQQNIDEVIHIIRASKDKQEAQANLIERFILTERQANAILDMRLSRLTNLEVDALLKELEELKCTIERLKAILADEKLVLEIVKTELIEVREKYGDERRTELSLDYGDIDIGDMIAEEEIVISMTKQGYIKRISASEYKAQRRGGKGITAHKPKDEDFVNNMFTTSTHDDLLFFTDFGKVYCIKGYEVPEASRTARGRAMVNLLQFALEENVTAVIPVKDYENGFLMMVTKKGLIKKTSIKEYESIRKGGKISAVLEDGDKLRAVLKTTGENEMLVATHEGKCIRFSENDVRAMGRATKGVKCMSLSKDDYIVDMLICDETANVLTVTENGYGKRTPLTDYRLQGRAGKGVKAGVLNDKTGKLVSLQIIGDEQDVLIISDDGTMIRTRSNEISVMSRDTIGVRLMRVNEDTKVTSVAVVDKEDEDNQEVTEDNAEATETTPEIASPWNVVKNQVDEDEE